MPTVSELKPLSAFLQEALQYPFERDTLEKLSMTSSIFEGLIAAYEQYQDQFLGQVKEGTTAQGAAIATPTFSLSRPATECWPGYFYQSRTIRNDRQILSRIGFGRHESIGKIKQTLLFSHGIFIDGPPLFNMEGNVPQSQFFAQIKEIFIELSELEPLISRKVVVPVPIMRMRPVNFEDAWLRPYGPINLPPKDEGVVRAVARQLTVKRPMLSEKDAKLYVIKAMMAAADAKASMKLYDPLLDDEITAEAFGEAILLCEEGITANNKLIPAMLQTLTTEYAIDPQKVTCDDIQTMRDNEEVFREWRQIMSTVLEHMVQYEGTYNDRNKEFKEFVEHNSRQWHEAISKIAGKGMLEQIRDDTREMKWYIANGIIMGAFVLTGHASTDMMGLATPLVRPLIKMFGNVYKSALDRHVRLSVRNHFLSIGSR